MSRWEVIGGVSKAPYPLVVHLPHASTKIPTALREDLLLSDEELSHELRAVTDHLTDELFEIGSGQGVCFVNRLSRLVFDPERFRRDEDEVMATRGIGAIYALTTDGIPLRDASVLAATKERILTDFYDPYALALQELVGEMVARFGRCLIVDAHSYPSTPFSWELRPDALRPPIAYGTDPIHTPLALVELLEYVAKERGVETARDVPFAGTYVPLKYLNQDERVSSVMIEVRRDLYLNESTAQPNDGFHTTKDLVGELLRAATRFIGG